MGEAPFRFRAALILSENLLEVPTMQLPSGLTQNPTDDVYVTSSRDPKIAPVLSQSRFQSTYDCPKMRITIETPGQT